MDIEFKNNSRFHGQHKVVFIGVFLGLLMIVALTNYLVDPYGRYGTDILNANRIDPRTWVEKMLRNQSVKPDLILFGSSRTMPLKPDFGRELRGVNAALFAGAIEDHYCILRYSVEKLNFSLRYAVIGLEPDLLLSSHPIDPMLVKNKSLGQYLEKKKKSPIQDFFKQPAFVDEIASLLSLTSLKNSCKIIFSFLMNLFNPKSAIADAHPEESTGIVSGLLEIVEEKKDSMEARLRQYKTLYSGVTSIDKDRLKYLYRFAEYAKKNHISVIAFIPGYSISFWSEMNQIDSFTNINQEFDKEMMRLKELYGWQLIDFRPGNYAGPELVFFDGVHPTKQTRYIIENIIVNKVINGL